LTVVVVDNVSWSTPSDMSCVGLFSPHTSSILPILTLYIAMYDVRSPKVCSTPMRSKVRRPLDWLVLRVLAYGVQRWDVSELRSRQPLRRALVYSIDFTALYGMVAEVTNEPAVAVSLYSRLSTRLAARVSRITEFNSKYLQTAP